VNRSKPLRRTPFRTAEPAALERTVPLQRRQGLRYRSAATARRYVTRRQIVAGLFSDPSVCEVPWCGDRATDPHEPLTRARGGSILDLGNIRLLCGAHHREIHDTEPGWAYDLGFLRHSWDEAS
jgi:hypothetical protein